MGGAQTQEVKASINQSVEVDPSAAPGQGIQHENIQADLRAAHAGGQEQKANGAPAPEMPPLSEPAPKQESPLVAAFKQDALKTFIEIRAGKHGEEFAKIAAELQAAVDDPASDVAKALDEGGFMKSHEAAANLLLSEASKFFGDPGAAKQRHVVPESWPEPSPLKEKAVEEFLAVLESLRKDVSAGCRELKGDNSYAVPNYVRKEIQEFFGRGATVEDIKDRVVRASTRLAEEWRKSIDYHIDDPIMDKLKAFSVGQKVGMDLNTFVPKDDPNFAEVSRNWSSDQHQDYQALYYLRGLRDALNGLSTDQKFHAQVDNYLWHIQHDREFPPLRDYRFQLWEGKP